MKIDRSSSLTRSVTQYIYPHPLSQGHVDDLNEIWVQGRLATHYTENGVFRAFEKTQLPGEHSPWAIPALTSEFFLREIVFHQRLQRVVKRTFGMPSSLSRKPAGSCNVPAEYWFNKHLINSRK